METASSLYSEMMKLADLLQRQRFNMVQEKLTQLEVERFLHQHAIQFDREHRLSANDIPDFLIYTKFGEIVLEVKLHFPRRAIYRQLERYAAHDSVHGLILLTGTSMGLPQTIKGKPTLLVSLGAGWL
jgi:hypothetical protein